MNQFFDPAGDIYAEVPASAYARMDRIENGVLLFEAIDAAWFDREIANQPDPKRWAQASKEAPISVIETLGMPQTDAKGRIVAIEYDEHGKSKPMGDLPENPWVLLRLDEAGENARFYPNLLAEGRPIAIFDIEAVAEEMRRDLDKAFSIKPYVADEPGLRRTLDQLRCANIEWVVVYDVGQGAANGLCLGDGRPVAYADIGGGVLANTFTFDWRLDAMCFSENPPIILSHWDWDHWSSGMRFPASQTMPWIVPLQDLGAVHSAFAAVLAGNQCLTVWPSGLASLGMGQVTIRKCTGTGRNHSGLAVEVHGPNGQSPILLPGDARYNVVPGALDRKWHAVVVPHHGADMRNASVPGSTGSRLSRAAYSCGHGNQFQHPRRITEQNHDHGGWPHKACHAAMPVDVRTDLARSAQRLGHMGLGWGSAAKPAHMPCHGLCKLTFEMA